MIRRPQRPTLSPSAPLSLSNQEDPTPAANDGLGIPAVRKAQAWGNVILGQGDVGTFAGAHYSDVSLQARQTYDIRKPRSNRRIGKPAGRMRIDLPLPVKAL